MNNYIPSEIEGLIAATSMPESIYVIYTDRSGPTKWTSSRAEAMDYVSKHKGSKYKSVKSI